jgi:penicillin V acylase-like amidase (Ntn superfamily)
LSGTFTAVDSSGRQALIVKRAVFPGGAAMKRRRVGWFAVFVCVLGGGLFSRATAACSTFMLAKSPHLVFGHNLNENGIDVPGLVFVNKRGVFKTGRTWSEMISGDRSNPSSLTWVSRYGSVTFNVFGRDFPDGGMNEVGLYIWEMSDSAEYPQNSDLPKLMHMNWMQFILDNYSKIDEVIESASEIQIDGWSWHYFVADSRGMAASIEFDDGDVVVRRGDRMPVPALMNEPYDREMEILDYFEGFGGTYPVQLDDMFTPRFAKTAVMLRDYDANDDPVEYGFLMLKNLTVAETPKWSVIFDVRNRVVYFKTRLNQEIKYISIKNLDFSNLEAVQILDIDIPSGGDVGEQLHPADDEEIFAFLMNLPLPDEFFSAGGLTRGGFCNRAAGQWHEAERPERQFFAGTWSGTETQEGITTAEDRWTVDLLVDGNRVRGSISRPSWSVANAPLDHLRMIGNRLEFTFRASSPDGEIYEVHAEIGGDRMAAHLFGMEDDYGLILFERSASPAE